jgi:hypothetical protein
MRRSRVDEPVLITTAPENADDEYDRRRRRYALMMALRGVCVIVAAVTYRYSLWLALACVVGGCVLPWCAVLLANDRPPRRSSGRAHYGLHSGERALPAGEQDGRTVDG